MDLRANTTVGIKVQSLLLARYNEQHPDAPLAVRRIDSLWHLLRTLRERHDSGEWRSNFADIAGLLAVRAMARGCDVEQTADAKAEMALNDMQLALLNRGLRRIGYDEGTALQEELAVLYAQPAQPGKLGAVGNTFLSVCRYHTDQIPRQKAQDRQRIRSRLRSAAIACDQATTLADQRAKANELSQLLLAALRPHISSHEATEIVKLFWDWATQHILTDPKDWQLPGFGIQGGT